MQELISWVDMETMLLLFSMMMIVGVLSETGVFDYFSDELYKWTKDSPTKLTFMLCLATAVFSLFLDNVTTILLLSPCTIRLCHMTNLNPVPVLMATVIFSNIGGTITPIGDPPNVLIASAFESAGVTLMNFVLHMGTGTIIVLVVTWVMLWNSFSDMSSLEYSESSDIVDLRRRMDVWQRLAESLSSYSKDEDSVRKSLKRKVQKLNKKLHKHDKNITSSLISEKGNKKDKSNEIQYALLIKTIVALVFTIVMFLVRSFTDVNITLGWIALLGAILLLILADEEPIDGVLGRVEWGTLLFFASLFILMEATSKLGLIQAIGNLTEYIIMLVHEETRLTLAILLILWVSAIVSALVDNIPLTTMMVRIISKLNAELGLPIQPLAWALAFGACLGGNGTLIGASANVVCAGVAEQHGYRFTFNEFFKVGFPVTLINIMISSIYLLVCHVFYTWH